MKKRKERTLKLKKEIQIKDLIIKELLTILTNNNIKLPDQVLEVINKLYGNDSDG